MSPARHLALADAHPEWHTRIEWSHEVACFALVGDEGLTLVDPLLPAPNEPSLPG